MVFTCSGFMAGVLKYLRVSKFLYRRKLYKEDKVIRESYPEIFPSSFALPTL